MQKSYKVHPMAMAFPKMPKAEFDELKADIQTRGIQIPILVNKKKDTILDGRNRIMAAHDLKLPDKQIPLEVFTGSEEEAGAAIISRNIMRRNLTDDQRAALLAKLLGPEIEKQAAANRKAGVAVKDNGQAKGTSEQRLAKVAKVSKGKARAALQTAKHAPKDLDAVIEGKQKLADAKKKVTAARGKTAKPKPEKPLRERVEAKFIKLMESFAVTDYKEVRSILRDLLAKAEK